MIALFSTWKGRWFMASLLFLLAIPVYCVMPYSEDVPPRYEGAFPDLTSLREKLQGHIAFLTGGQGSRSVYIDGSLDRAAAYIERELRVMGYEVLRQPFKIGEEPQFGSARGKTVYNLQVIKQGTDPQAKVFVVGAHYDTWVREPYDDVKGVVNPGANDNGSGVSALLEMARMLKDVPMKQSVNFVAYVNEELPFFQTPSMGSVVHAQSLVRAVGVKKVKGMIAIDSVAHSLSHHTGQAKKLFQKAKDLSSKTEYITFLSTNTGLKLSKKAGRIFSLDSRYPVHIKAFPYLSENMAWSDDWAYMKESIPSFCAVDMAFLYGKDYHQKTDTADRIDYAEFSEVVHGLTELVRDLGNEE